MNWIVFQFEVQTLVGTLGCSASRQGTWSEFLGRRTKGRSAGRKNFLPVTCFNLPINSDQLHCPCWRKVSPQHDAATTMFHCVRFRRPVLAALPPVYLTPACPRAKVTGALAPVQMALLTGITHSANQTIRDGPCQPRAPSLSPVLVAADARCAYVRPEPDKKGVGGGGREKPNLLTSQKHPSSKLQ
ncbi:hypothetical protein CCH79_00012063 [Gambusia affinis]|uniref:Uncharacterized protein n=1 Tax=Gambusia affinis TaxID=33528 RepID=A0A315WSH5_GAMAF|nr:hypothetical protein CCH79_00012063 [Gambusia affinis]